MTEGMTVKYMNCYILKVTETILSLQTVQSKGVKADEQR